MIRTISSLIIPIIPTIRPPMILILPPIRLIRPTIRPPMILMLPLIRLIRPLIRPPMRPIRQIIPSD